MKTYEDVADSIERWRTILHLEDWQIDIKQGVETPQAFAEMGMIPGRKVAVIHLSECFLDSKDSEQQEMSILHELLHIYTRPIRDMAVEIIEECKVSHDLIFAVNKATSIVMEYSNDSLTTIVFELTKKKKKGKGK